MTQHQNNVGYFTRMAKAAKTIAHRLYWLKRKEGLEAINEQLESDRIAREKIKQREDNLNRFEKLDAPPIRMKSMHPDGCIIYWDKPTKWEPDTYIVLVRESPREKWRSVASNNITRETRKMVLTRSFLSWGEYREPYYICVAAVKNGVGRKESSVLIYPPDFVDKWNAKQKADDIKELDGSIQTEPQKKSMLNATREMTRIEIIHAFLVNEKYGYKGRILRNGKPNLWDLRKQLPMTPKITRKERNSAYQMKLETENK